MFEQSKDVHDAVQALLGLPSAFLPLSQGPTSAFNAVENPHCLTQQSDFSVVSNDDAHYRSCSNDSVSLPSSTPVPSPFSQIVSAPPSPPLSLANNLTTGSTMRQIDDSLIKSSSVSVTSNGVKFYAGSCSLALPEDDEHLSPLHCFMRAYCVEVFTARDSDLVGIRCLHCKGRQDRAERSSCFPSALKNIYHSIETWQRRHSAACTHIPASLKREMAALMQRSRSGAGGRRAYWEDSAKRIGLVDTPHGIKFIRPVGTVMEMSKPITVENTRPSVPIVRPDDIDLDISGFLYMLLDQMETCYFTTQDRVGGRSKVKSCSVGYPGIQCKHCSGKAGFGRYFPLSQSALTSANSDRNIFNHVVKCRKCPLHIRDTLTQLVTQHGATAKNKRGTRKEFFGKIWQRMHQDDTS